MSSGGGGTSNTVTSTQEIPQFEQQAVLNNIQYAQGLQQTPFPNYNAPLIQGMDPLQTQGINQAVGASGSYVPYANAAGNSIMNSQPYLDAASGQVANANGNIQAATGTLGAGMGATQQAQALTNPNAVGAYMNPYIQDALAPQISDLQTQLAQQQNGINQTATQANAFGDARQGAAQGLQNYYGNQALNQLIGTGYNNAYTQAQQAVGQAENTQLGAASQYGNQANAYLGAANANLQGGGLLNTLGNTELAQGGAYGTLGSQVQNEGLTGANAVYQGGQQYQTQGQNELNAAYQQFLNQVNWPYQGLNVAESALSNNPYNIQTATTLPQSNQVAQGFGGLAALAGLGGAASGSKTNVFGGS